MFGVTGWKTTTGVLFGAFASVVYQNADFFDPSVYRVLMMILTFGSLVLSGLGIAHKIEKGAARIAGESNRENRQAGSARLAAILILALLTIMPVAMVASCAPQQTATQQISQQTNDPAIIALATYADGLKAYADAQEIYKPYQKILEETQPAVNEQIKGYFSEAWAILKKWKAAGSIGYNDQQSFRALIRQISINLARQIDDK